VYWRTLAEELAAGHADLAAKRAANKRARTYFRDKRISEQSVERISRAHYNIRDTTGAIVGRGNYRDFWLGALEIEHRKRRGPDIAPVRAYLKRHSKRGSL
jgi:hypothetical protein